MGAAQEDAATPAPEGSGSGAAKGPDGGPRQDARREDAPPGSASPDADADDRRELHRERVLPSAGTWLAAPALAALTGLAVAPLGVGAVVAAVLGVAALVAVLLRLASPLVVVTGDELVAGRARIPRALLGPVTGYDGEDARRQRGPVLDARAFLVMRGWADGVVRVEVLDPADPTPYWLVSTHRPAALSSALQRGRAEGGGPQGSATPQTPPTQDAPSAQDPPSSSSR